MAIYSLNFHSVTVGKKSVLSRAAYVSASKMQSERTGQTVDYTRKKGVQYTEFMLPENCPEISREDFWNRVEADVTEAGRVYAKTGHIALPKEWTDEQKIEYARAFLKKNFTDKGHAVDWAFHNEPGNPHVDYLVSQKRINAKGQFLAPKSKEVFANDRDENGKAIFNPNKPSYDPKNKEATAAFRLPVIDKKTGEQKVRVREGKGKEYLWEKVKIEDESLNSKSFLLALRKNWEDFANEHLDEEYRIDCRSLEAQGIEREAQIHMGPCACAMEKKEPGSSERVARNKEIINNNSVLIAYTQLWNLLQNEINRLRNNIILSVRERFSKLSLSCQEPHSQEKEVQAWKPPAKASKPIRPWEKGIGGFDR